MKHSPQRPTSKYPRGEREENKRIDNSGSLPAVSLLLFVVYGSGVGASQP